MTSFKAINTILVITFLLFLCACYRLDSTVCVPSDIPEKIAQDNVELFVNSIATEVDHKDGYMLSQSEAPSEGLDPCPALDIEWDLRDTAFDLPHLHLDYNYDNDWVPESCCHIFNWRDYEHRLDEAKYYLRIHNSINDEIESIIIHNLIADGVIHGGNPLTNVVDIALYSEDVQNLYIFYSFLENNVTIELFEDSFDREGYVRWLAYDGGLTLHSLFNKECKELEFDMWLISFEDEYIYIWDTKTLALPGCRKVLLFP